MSVATKTCFVGICSATVLIVTVILFNWEATSASLLLLYRQVHIGLDDAYVCGLRNLLPSILMTPTDVSGRGIQKLLNPQSLEFVKSLGHTEQVDSLQSMKLEPSLVLKESLQKSLGSKKSMKSSRTLNGSTSNQVRIAPLSVKADDPMCIQCLSEPDKAQYYQCNHKRSNIPGPGGCHFINSSRRAAVALASLPGSGNTWVRGLLEKATGICTGAIYCDVTLLKSGMYGEGMTSGSVIAVKTHRLSPEWTTPDTPKSKHYGGAILIIRNPYDASIAEWNRLSSGHTGRITDKNKFGEYPCWNKHVNARAELWPSYFKSWVVEAQQPTHVVRFEDLKIDAVREVMKMLDYLNIDYVPEEVKTRLHTDYGKFQRRHEGDDFEHFTLEQRHVLNQTISSTIDYLQKAGFSTFGIQDYLWYH